MRTPKFSFLHILIASIIGAGVSYLVLVGFVHPSEHVIETTKSAVATNKDCNYNIARLGGYHFIKPLLFADQNCESEKYSPLKSSIANMIEQFIATGFIDKASVYLRDLKDGEWIACNGNQQFNPGSLMKVPLMIAILKMEEQKPGFLNKEILFDKPYEMTKTAHYMSDHIKTGKKYSLKQLLHYTIAFSDNQAASILSQQLNVEVFKNVFTDIGLPPVDIASTTYPVSAKDFSEFMEELYNASYLTIPHSEYATELLGACDFKDGIVSGLPSDITIAHKFGEAGSDNDPQLHESAIVYLKGSPYLLTIMTRGKDFKKQAGVISNLSRLVYDAMAKPV